MTFITRSLPLVLDILLLGVVEPPDWAGENVGPGSGTRRCIENSINQQGYECQYRSCVHRNGLGWALLKSSDHHST
jgi:hypothetical protein